MTISGTSPAQPLPTDRNRMLDALDAMGASTGAALADAAYVTQLAEVDETGMHADLGNIAIAGGTAAGLGAGYLTVKGLQSRLDSSGSSRQLLDLAAHGASRLGTLARANSVRITPTLVAAVAGPAIADGITAVAPKVVKKQRDIASVTNASAKQAAAKDNQWAKYSRMAVAGTGVGALGIGAFMLRPSLFRGLTNDTVRFVSDAAIQGRTFASFRHEDTVVGLDFLGKRSDSEVREALRARGDGRLRDGAELTLRHRQGIDPFHGASNGDIPGNPVTSNRIAVGALGGAGTLALAGAAAAADPQQQTALWAGTAGVAAATVGGVAGVGALTRHMVRTRGTDTLLARNAAFPKIPINPDTLRSYGKVLSVTAVPAATSAGMYYNVFDDFEDIVSTRSQFRR